MLTKLSVALTGIKLATFSFDSILNAPNGGSVSMKQPVPQRWKANTWRSRLTAVRWRRSEPFIRSEPPELWEKPTQKNEVWQVMGNQSVRRHRVQQMNLRFCGWTVAKQNTSCVPEGSYQEKTNPTSEKLHELTAGYTSAVLEISKIILRFRGSKLCCQSSKRALCFSASLHMH